jgi:hypothetical protein
MFQWKSMEKRIKNWVTRLEYKSEICSMYVLSCILSLRRVAVPSDVHMNLYKASEVLISIYNTTETSGMTWSVNNQEKLEFLFHSCIDSSNKAIYTQYMYMIVCHYIHVPIKINLWKFNLTAEKIRKTYW